MELTNVHREFESHGKAFPRGEDSFVLGLCTGSLAAAAVSSSSSLSELLPLAVQTVLISLRLGLRTVTMRDRIETSSQHRSGSWSAAVVGMDSVTANAVIEKFFNRSKLPASRRPWIASLSAKAVTVSAPPLVLDELLSEPGFASLKPRRIAVNVPGHNSTIYTNDDIAAILETTNTAIWSAYPARLPLVSASTGTLSWATDFRVQMEQALAHCLLEPIQFGAVEKELPRMFSSRGITGVSIVPVGTSADRSLAKAVGLSVKEVVTEQLSNSEGFSHRSGEQKEKIAIVSMSGRFPESRNTDEFWQLLKEGLDVVKEVPKRRWDVETHVDPKGRARNKGATKWGCWLDFAGDFDPRFFSISPKEAPQMDPAQRMALMSTYEAMERGGIVPDTTPSTQRNRIGVFHGVTSNDWMETNTAQNIDTYFITGGNRGFIPGRINFCFEFSGPRYVTLYVFGDDGS
jgi:noranthrone synthase